MVGEILRRQPQHLDLRRGGRVRLFAFRADPAQQPLRHHRPQRRRHQERFHPHVDQSGDRARRVVGVQRTEHQVTGQRGVDGDFSGFNVADLSDHDDVRRLTEHRAERRGEGHLHVPVHLHLVDAGQLVFDRVFDGDDLAARSVDRVKKRVE